MSLVGTFRGKIYLMATQIMNWSSINKFNVVLNVKHFLDNPTLSRILYVI